MGFIYVISWRPEKEKSKSRFSQGFLEIMPKVSDFDWRFEATHIMS